MIRSYSGQDATALICLKDISLQLHGISVTDEQYLQFAKDLGEPFFAQLEQTVATME